MRCEYLNVPTKPFVSPNNKNENNNSLNVKSAFNLRTSENRNYISYVSKRLENNCSGVNKNYINKDDNSCNTPRKLGVNNPLRIFVEQLNINSKRNKFTSRL